VAVFVLTAVFATVVVAQETEAPVPASNHLTLVVGGQDEMKTRNPLPAIAGDRWTEDVFGAVYDTVIRTHPITEAIVPYIAKGVDADGDGTFETGEYGQFARSVVDWQGNPCDETAATGFCALNLTAFYDFNGVFFHDGAPADVWDLLLSYHLAAMDPQMNSPLQAVMADDFATTRQMNVSLVRTDGADWTLALPAGASASRRASIRFLLETPYVRFSEATLAVRLFPQHVWDATGQRGEPATVTDIHPDFGCMLYPATASGAYTDTSKAGRAIPPGATDLPIGCTKPFDYAEAERWAPADEDVIGSGPFAFETWSQGSFTMLLRHDRYFVGRNPDDPSEIWDPDLLAYMHLPTAEGILFKIYRSTTLGVLALKRAEIDFYHWSIPAEFVPDMASDPNIAIEFNAEPGFAYMGYNLRREPYGYGVGGADVGLPLRTAMSHIVDRRSIVQNLLQGFGVAGYGPVSPANVFWYNPGIPKPGFDKTLASSILNAQGWTDSPGDCTKDTPSGCRSLPVIGTRVTEILTPQADYDPVRAAAGQMIADSLRSIGLNYVSLPLAYGEIVARLDARNFDQYILDRRLSGTDPDFLFDHYHSSNAPSGQNTPGYVNATFDTLIETSRTQLDRAARRLTVLDVQLNLAQNRPDEVLYYRTNIEAYRQDRWVNWTVASGTIWNYWSLIGIHPPGSSNLRVLAAIQPVVASGISVPLLARVFDNNGSKIAGAAVNLTATHGNVSIGATPGKTVSGVTNPAGLLMATYHAPTLLAGDPTLTEVIDLVATHADYPDPGRRQVLLSIVPPGLTALAITVDFPEGDQVYGGSVLPVSLAVSDEQGATADAAFVTISWFDMAVDGVFPQSGLAADMRTVTLSASASVTLATMVAFTVSANLTGYSDAYRPFEVTVLPTPPNVLPIAVAAAWPPEAHVGELVFFDAANSTDADGLLVSYSWDLGDSSVAFGVSVDHTYSSKGPFLVTLTIQDNRGGVATDTLTVAIMNRDPTAVAGPDLVVLKEAFSLNGSASADLDGDALSFNWSRTSGPAGTVSGATSPVMTFRPPVSGIYTFELRVDDGDGGVATDVVLVTVVNRDPMAVAGPDLVVPKGPFTLNGSASTDPDGDALSFNWTKTGGPAGVLSGGTLPEMSFQPTAAGTYAFELRVDDGDGGAGTANVSVVVWSRPPVANVTANRLRIEEGQSVTFDATGSLDSDGSVVRYEFDFGDGGSASGDDGAVAHRFERPGTYRILLVVIDDDGNRSVAAEVVVLVEPSPLPLLVGAVLVVGAVAALALWWRRRRKGEGTKEAPAGEDPVPVTRPPP